MLQVCLKGPLARNFGLKTGLEEVRMPILVISNLSDFPSFDIYIIFLNVCMSVCPLPFFLTMAKPFPLKLGSSLGYGVGQTAKHFGTK